MEGGGDFYKLKLYRKKVVPYHISVKTEGFRRNDIAGNHCTVHAVCCRRAVYLQVLGIRQLIISLVA